METTMHTRFGKRRAEERGEKKKQAELHRDTQTRDRLQKRIRVDVSNWFIFLKFAQMHYTAVVSSALILDRP